MAGGVEYQVTKVDPTSPQTKGMVHQVHKVSEEIAATIGGKVYRARIINDPTAPTVAGKVYQIVLIDDPDDPSVRGMVYNAILTGGSEAVVVGPAVSPLSLPDAIADSLTYVKAFGGTEQNGTPTPTVPVDIVSNNGIIKFSPNEANYTADNVVLGYWLRNSDGQPESSPANFYTNMMPVKPNISYVCFGRNKETNTISGYNRIAWYDADGVWIRNSTYTQNQPGIDVAPSNAAFARFHCNINGTPVTQELVDSYNWVFQQGTAEVPYVPYVEGGLYTDGTVETIGIYGNNLIDLSAVTDGYYYDPQGNYTALSAARLTDYIPVEAGKDVKIYFKSLSTISTLNVRINIFNSSKVWQSQEVLSLESLSDGTKTITPTYNGYIRVSGNYSGGAIVDWNAASVTESLGSATTEMLLKVGDYQDVQSIIDGVVTRNVGVLVLDGTENWTTRSGSDTHYAYFDYSGINANTETELYCTHFGVSARNISEESKMCVRLNRNGFLFCNDLLCANNTTWTQYLADQYAAGTPVMIIYPLATPTTESVAGQTLQVQQGDNTLEITQASMTGLELEAKYEKESA